MKGMVVEIEWVDDISGGSRYWFISTEPLRTGDVNVGGFLKALPMYDVSRIWEGAHWMFLNASVVWRFTVISDDAHLQQNGTIE